MMVSAYARSDVDADSLQISAGGCCQFESTTRDHLQPTRATHQVASSALVHQASVRRARLVIKHRAAMLLDRRGELIFVLVEERQVRRIHPAESQTVEKWYVHKIIRDSDVLS